MISVSILLILCGGFLIASTRGFVVLPVDTAELIGALAENLDGLYDYMQRQLFRATVDNDASLIAEVAGLLETLKEGWTAMDLTQIEAPRVSHK